MPITVAWDNEEQVILRYEFIAPWTWEDYRLAVEKGWAEGRYRPYDVHVIIDFTRVGPLPQGYLTHFSRTAMTRIGPNAGLFVMIGVTGFMLTVHQLMSQLFPRLAERVVYVDSVEAARAVIARHIADSKSGE